MSAPLIVRHVDCRTQQVLQSVVFVGPVPRAVEDELRKMQNKPRSSTVLAKHFGKRYESLLGFNVKRGGANSIGVFGGAEDSYKAPSDGVEQAAYDARLEYDMAMNEELADQNDRDFDGGVVDEQNEPADDRIGSDDEQNAEQSDVRDEPNEPEAAEAQVPVKPDAHQGTLADFDLGVELGLGAQQITIDEEEVRQAEEEQQVDVVQLDLQAKPVHNVTLKLTGQTRFVTDYSVGPYDNIMDLKRKIFAATGIPIYRQHLWVKAGGKNYPMYYKIYQNRHAITVDIGALIEWFQAHGADRDKLKDSEKKITPSAADDQATPSTEQEIEGCPVNLAVYRARDTQHISALDTFTLVSGQCEALGASTFYVADLNDIIDPAEIYASIGKDKFALDMLYYGFVRVYFPMISAAVFTTYLRNEKDMVSVFPDLALRRESCVALAKQETRLTVAAENSNDHGHGHGRDSLASKLHMSVTQTMISVNGFYPDREIGLNLRNLFDTLALDSTVCYARAHLLHENRAVILRKSYYNEQEPRDTNPLNTVLIKIRTNADTNENIRMIIYKNGNYYVRTEWREETHMNFERIGAVTATHINSVVKRINAMGSSTFYYKFSLPQIDRHNTQFTESSMVVYYEDDTTDAKWQILQKILRDYQAAGIIDQKEVLASSGALEYFFRKGMFTYDAERIEKLVTLENYYEYLSNSVVRQKWATIFERTRLMEISQQANRLKISINGVRCDEEIDSFMMYISGLLRVYSEAGGKIRATATDSIRTKSAKTLKNLKQLDPILYDFKKIYKSPVIYSKICQRPYQPLLLNKREYDALPRATKDRAVKYWNFTTQSAAYYSCPNPKYPFVKFIIKQHPKDYCIPCCKKIMMHERVNPKKQEIHNECMERFKYTGERVSLTKGSHYIAAYGKSIEVGRIARLPEHTLEPLFFDTYSPDGGIDQECATMDGYYLVGVDQNTSTMRAVGMLFVVVHALQTDVQSWLASVALALKRAPSKFRGLMGGQAAAYFMGAEDLAAQLPRLYDDQLFATRYEQVPWNELIGELAFHFSGLNTIKFVDAGHENIHLQLPAGLKTADEMFPASHKCVVVINVSRTSHYYPIYLLNTELYKRSGVIDQRIFSNDTGLITTIKAVVRKHFESSNYEQVRTTIDLFAVREFAKHARMTVVAIYVNGANLAYAAALIKGGRRPKKHAMRGRGDMNADERDNNDEQSDEPSVTGGAKSTSLDEHEYYFPCQPSHYVDQGGYEIRLQPIDSLERFVGATQHAEMISAYNAWVSEVKREVLEKNVEADVKRNERNSRDVSADEKTNVVTVPATIYPEIIPTQLIGLVSSKEIIGFICDAQHYYFAPTPLSQLRPAQWAALPIRRMRYDPQQINQVLADRATNQVGQFLPEIIDQMEFAAYLSYFYQMVLGLCIEEIDRARNATMRAAFLRVLRATNFDGDTSGFRTFLETKVADPDDRQKINKLVGRFLAAGRDMKKLVAGLGDLHFNFDRQFLVEIAGKGRALIKKKLAALVARRVAVVDKISARGFRFPNQINDCRAGSKVASLSYCRGTKLLGTRAMFDEAMEIIAAELEDKNKWKWLLNVNYLDKVSSFMRFISRPGEHITVEFVK